MALITRRTLWLILAVAFAAMNVWAVAVAGIDGIGEYLTTLGPIGTLAAVDLILALLAGLAFLLQDARVRGRDGRPFVVLTLLTGSLGLLAYLAAGPDGRRAFGEGRLQERASHPDPAAR